MHLPFAYTPPLPLPPAAAGTVDALTAFPRLQLAFVALAFAAVALKMGLPRTSRPVPPAATPGGPVWCERTRRWRDPVSRRFVKSPLAV